jgi:hypothetical protein|nr:MAG TPA: zinc-ribbon containing domain protein [Caudoviricetes sp.]
MENKTPKSDLIPCEHCGHMISKTAKTCPECGGKNRKYISAGKVVLIVVMLIIFAYLEFMLSASFVAGWPKRKKPAARYFLTTGFSYWLFTI